MSAPEIVAELRTLGVDLWAEEGQIRFRAPKGVLTGERREALRAHKTEIVELLARDGVIPDHDARHEPFPLTDVQTAYLLGRRDSFGYGGVACHGYLELTYPRLDPARAEEAWNTLIARHDMLRAVISEDGYQRVLPSVPRFGVPARDLRGASEAEVSAALEEARGDLGHRRYDPATWPLFGLRITRHDGGDVLHISMDSLIADWASAAILLDELDALLAEPGRELPPLELGFRDYVLAERAQRDTGRYRSDRDYWHARVDDLPPAPDLPRRAQEGDGPVRFVRHHGLLDGERWAALREHARRHGLTASTAVLAAYAAVLGRWARRPRFSLNLTLLNRQPLHPDVDRLVGDFTSVSLLAVENGAGESFAEQARRLGQQLFADLDHRLCSGVEVVREIARRRGRDAALMPVVFTSGIGLGPARRTGTGITQTPQVFLDCQVTEGPDGLEVNWDVREGIFPGGVVADMFGAFTALLDRLASGEAWQSTEPVPLPAWQVEERAAVNDTAGPLPDTRLHAEFFARAARTPDAVAVTGPAGTLTYGELARRAGAVGAAVRDAGLGAGDRVAILMDRGPEQVTAVLGVLLAGAAYQPVDTTQPPLRRERLLRGVRLVLTQSWLTERPEAPALDVDTLPPAPELPTVDGGDTGDADALAYVIHTSGSTGDPKGVLVTHRAALNTVADINRRFGVTSGDRVLGLAQLGFDLSVYDILGPLSVGGGLVLPDTGRPGDPSHWAWLAAEYGVTVWNSVPAQLQMLVNYLDSEPVELPSLRLGLLSGDWLPVTLPAQATAHVPGLSLVSLGGATEAAIWSIHHAIDRVDPEWTSIPYGRPLTNQGFRVLDDAFRDCPVWTTGELYITGAGLATGYLDDPHLTAAKFFGHPVDGQRLYRTGDLGRYLPGGEIEFLGREDNQVKIRGHRIELGEIEAALLAHDDVGGAAAVVDGDGLLGFAEPARHAEDGDMHGLDRTIEAVRRFADRQVSEFDADQVAAHVRVLHDAACVSMLRTLTRRGAFAAPRTAGDVLRAARVPEPHHWLVGRWLGLLAEAGHLAFDPVTGRYTRPTDVSDVTDEAVRQAWERAELQAETGLCTPEFVRYHVAHVERIDALLDGEQNPFELLFPEGRTDPALAVYRDDPIARYLNHGAAALLNRIAAARDEEAGPLRVLEAGAGTGATTSAVLPMLAGFDVDYLFTDVTPFFLPSAREEFAGFDGLRTGVFDLDGDHRGQGLAPNSFDVVLCAGMLNSTRDPAAALRRAVELLAPGGWLVFTEPTAEHPHILLTQGFLMEPREDGTLLSHERWQELAEQAGAHPVLCLPEDGHPQAAQGMRLFAARVKTGRRHVTAEQLGAFLAERLPAHMVPGHVQLVDELPLTGNGKVDRKLLATWRPAPLAGGDTGEAAPSDELEARLCALWASALGVARIGRDDNVYDRGADSLVMARVAGRLREEVPEAADVPYDTLLRQLLNEPTVAALARSLTTLPPADQPLHRGRSEPGNALLVPFGGGDEGPARVLFHAALGTMDYFQSIGGALARQELGPVVGMAVADAEAYCAIEPKELVGRVADDYTDRLLAEGHTRFQLIGYCLGGLLATEVARRLLERGVPVEDLTLVDSIPMFIETDEELAFESIFVPNLGLDPVATVFGDDLDPADVYRAIDALMTEHDRVVPAGALAALGGDPGLDAVAAAARRQHERTQEERLAGYAAAAAERSGIPVGPELVPALFRVCRHSMRAARFDPEPYAGSMTFLRATEQQSFGITAGVGHLAAPFWQRTCLGGFTVIDVPGNHFSVIEPPQVDVIATHLATPLMGERQ